MSKVADFLRCSWFRNGLRKIRIMYLVVFLMLTAQIILSVILFLRLANLNTSFLEYREASMKRINQIYGQVYSLSTRLIEKK